MTDNKNLDDDVALVTGASSGIGRATAKTLAQEDADVAVAARRTERLESLVEEIEDETDSRAHPITADLTEREQVKEMVQKTRDELGGLDILVNNAGVMLLAPVERAKLDELQQMLDLNLMGLMTATREALPGMLEQDEGHIVNISSVAGKRATEASGGYAAT
ncbi:MAG: SDR family oxidoreductase, partial [Halobacteria archaeon]|nr:SDR family oxidoreductase [Halobacteria archaeon]